MGGSGASGVGWGWGGRDGGGAGVRVAWVPPSSCFQPRPRCTCPRFPPGPSQGHSLGRGLSTLRTQFGVLKAKPRGLGDIGSCLAWYTGQAVHREQDRREAASVGAERACHHRPQGPGEWHRSEDSAEAALRALSLVRLALVAAAITALPPPSGVQVVVTIPGL